MTKEMPTKLLFYRNNSIHLTANLPILMFLLELIPFTNFVYWFQRKEVAT